jgi:hypothetical protein
MGFRKPIEKSDVVMQITSAYSYIKSPYSDGFSAWYTKQELYEIKFVLDEVIKQCPEFTGEPEWLEEQHKKQMWSELKR